VIGPLTLEAWLAQLRRRFGTSVKLRGDHLAVRKLANSPTADRESLAAVAPQVLALLISRAEKRRQRQEEATRTREQEAEPPQGSRRVIGMIVNPGRPLRLLYADEVEDIDPRRARVLGKAWEVPRRTINNKGAE
jgi:hypothetical protein